MRSITYDPKGDTTETVVKAYQALFDAKWPLVDKYDTTVEVGRDIDHNAVLKIYCLKDIHTYRWLEREDDRHSFLYTRS